MGIRNASIRGISGNFAAVAGTPGEVKEIRATTSQASGATTVRFDGTDGSAGDGHAYLTLSPGVWLLCASVWWDKNGATIAADAKLECGFSTTTGNFSTGLQLGTSWTSDGFPSTSVTEFSQQCGPLIVNLTSDTTYYWKLKNVFSVATPNYRGHFQAVRLA